MKRYEFSARLLQSTIRTITTMSKTSPRRFAPLKPAPVPLQSDVPKLQGIIFDVDGTLCLPQNYMFAQMRAELGINPGVDILGHISSLPSAHGEQEAAMEAIRAIERNAMASQEPQSGLVTLMSYLQERNVRKAICTRNFDQPVAHLLSHFLPGHHFEPVITRAFNPPKPDPAGLLFIARSWGLVRDIDDKIGAPMLDMAGTKSESSSVGVGVGAVVSVGAGTTEKEEEVGDASALIMVGDSIDDMTAGRRAGAATVLLANSENAHLAEHPHTDLVIRSLDELVDVLEVGFVGREIPASTS